MSILSSDPPFGRGTTLGVSSVNDGKGLVGQFKTFLDVDTKTGQMLSNRPVTAIVVRNTSGGALLPGVVVQINLTNAYAAGAATSTQTAVVDEYLPAGGVAANDVFYGIVIGPTAITTAGTLAAGALFKGDAAGEIQAGAGMGYTLAAKAANGRQRCIVGSQATSATTGIPTSPAAVTV